MAVKRDKHGKFLKGSEALGGRPKGSKGIAAYIKEKTNNLKDVVDCYIEILQDNKAAKKDRIVCGTKLMEYGIGRPVQNVKGEFEHDGSITFQWVGEDTEQ